MTARPAGAGNSLLSQLVMGLLVVGLLAGAIYLGVLEARREQRVAAGNQAPAFKLEKYGGGTLSLEDQRGKVVMLDFWATWCPPCIKEMPSLVKLAREYEPQGLVFVAANRDDEDEQKAAVGIFIADEVPDLAPHVVFADDPTTVNYRVETLPTLYLIDREGLIVRSVSGLTSEARMRAMIEEALEQ